MFNEVINLDRLIRVNYSDSTDEAFTYDYLGNKLIWFYSQKVGNQDKVLFRKTFEFNALGLRHVFDTNPL